VAGGVLFSLFITRRVTPHRTHSACFVMVPERYQGRRSSALEQRPRPLLVTSAADTSRAMWVRCGVNRQVMNNENSTRGGMKTLNHTACVLDRVGKLPTASNTTATLSREVPMKSGLAASEMCTRSKRSIPRSSWAHGYRPTTKCRCSSRACLRRHQAGDSASRRSMSRIMTSSTTHAEVAGRYS
jgi:hypothetical protein